MRPGGQPHLTKHITTAVRLKSIHQRQRRVASGYRPLAAALDPQARGIVGEKTERVVVRSGNIQRRACAQGKLVVITLTIPREWRLRLPVPSAGRLRVHQIESGGMSGHRIGLRHA